MSLEEKQSHPHHHRDNHQRQIHGDHHQPGCEHKATTTAANNNHNKAKSQPVQFSFTLYDLDGHGKITKDDIAGIVSTIYDSLGKSVVVPHYGSKTINVRLTVSPDSTAAAQTTAPTPAQKADKTKKLATPRRRYRPRKLLSDDENSDSSNDLNHKNCMSSPQKVVAGHQKLKATTTTKGSPMKSPLKEFSVMAPVATVAPILTTTPTLTEAGERNLINLKTPTNSIYMNLDTVGHALYDTVKHPQPLKVGTAPEIIISPYHEPTQMSTTMAKHQHMLMQQKELRKKLVRKTRSRKQKVRKMQILIQETFFNSFYLFTFSTLNWWLRWRVRAVCPWATSNAGRLRERRAWDRSWARD